MTDDDIRNALKPVKTREDFLKQQKVFETLAKQYLKIASMEGMPKEQELLSNPPLHDFEDGEIEGANEMRQSCILASVKREQELETIVKEETVKFFDAFKIPFATKDYSLDELIQAIRQRLEFGSNNK